MAAFKGVWIAAELFQDKSLTDRDRLLYSYMKSFPSGDFFASDLHISETLGWPHKTVRNVMSRLRKLGYVKGRKPMSRFRDISTPSVSQTRDNGCPASGTIDIRGELNTEESKVTRVVKDYPISLNDFFGAREAADAKRLAGARNAWSEKVRELEAIKA